MRRLFLAVVPVLLLSCTTIPDAEEPDDSLVVGTLQVLFPDGLNNQPDIGRVFRSHLRIHVTNRTRGAGFSILTSEDGHFSFLARGSETYSLDEVELVVENRGRQQFRDNPNYVFVAAPKAVFFLGDFTLTCSNRRFIRRDEAGVDQFRYLTRSFDRKVVSSPREYLSRKNPGSRWLSLHIETPETFPPAARPRPLSVQPSAEGSVALRDVSLDDIFPVFRTFYSDHAVGSVVLHNGLDKPISNIKASFQIREFMNEATECRVPEAVLDPGQTEAIELYALFDPRILETTENSRAQARIDVQYTVVGQVQHQSLVRAVSILRRNSTTWTNDRRAAAFVTTSDPAVLFFSKNINAMVKGTITASLSPNLLTAMGLFSALQLYGLTYAQDPIPTLTSNNEVVDYVQFPRQTLVNKGGKCSDLTVLYSALLESLGIETAFVTIPGHIFVAFSVAMEPSAASRMLSNPDDFIAYGDRNWVPLEITESAGFLKAWRDGAREWRENLARGQASFYPVREAWKLYQPVALPGSEVSLQLPSPADVVARYREEWSELVHYEISPEIARITARMKEAVDTRKLTNSLGVLYAKYGMYDLAEHEFELLAREGYVPGLVNLGNIHYLAGQKKEALQSYKRAYAQEPGDPGVLLALARLNNDLGNYDEAAAAYADLKARDPALAQRFPFLGATHGDTRQADAGGPAADVLWEE